LGSDTTTGEDLREATEPWWSHLWSHPPTFVQVHRRSHQYDSAGHERKRHSATIILSPENRKVGGSTPLLVALDQRKNVVLRFVIARRPGMISTPTPTSTASTPPVPASTGAKACDPPTPSGSPSTSPNAVRRSEGIPALRPRTMAGNEPGSRPLLGLLGAAPTLCRAKTRRRACEQALLWLS
jgi:hypothetical protein